MPIYFHNLTSLVISRIGFCGFGENNNYKTMVYTKFHIICMTFKVTLDVALVGNRLQLQSTLLSRILSLSQKSLFKIPSPLTFHHLPVGKMLAFHKSKIENL